MVFVYTVPVSLFVIIIRIGMGEKSEAAFVVGFAIPILAMLIVCALVIVNIVAAAAAVAKSKCLSFRTVLAYKLCLIPFYILNFACWAVASMVFHVAIVVWPLIPFIIAYTYFTMIGTSAHVIAKLLALRKAGAITSKRLIVHFLMQVTFTLDVASVIYLAVKQKRLESAE